MNYKKTIHLIPLLLAIVLILTACSSSGGGASTFSMFEAPLSGTGAWNRLVYEYNDLVYFEPNTYDSGIWKMNADGSGLQQIVESDDQFVWYADDSNIYFGGGTYMKMYTLTDGYAEYEKKLDDGWDWNYELYFVQIYNDHIYFICDDHPNRSINRVNMDFEELEVVHSSNSIISSFWIDDNMLYIGYRDNGIHALNLKTGETNEILPPGEYYRIYVDNGTLYYVGGDAFSSDYLSLCSIPCDGSSDTPTRLTSSFTCSSYNVAGEWIYYFNVQDESEEYCYSLYRIQTDGSNNTKILDGSEIMSNANSKFGVDITENWIYYKNANGDFCRCDKNGKNIEIIWSKDQ